MDKNLQESAVTVAFKRHESALRAFVSHMVESPADVDDVTQEAFLRAFNADPWTIRQISESDDLSTRFNALVNIPLIQDRLSVRLSGYYRDQAGMLDIAAPRNEDDVDTQKEEGVRIKLNWYATDKLEVSLMGNYLDTAYGGPANASFPYGSTVITSDVFPNGGEDLQEQANLTVRYDLGFAELVGR